MASKATVITDGPVTVRAWVPGREETKISWGVDLYADDIQPIWLQIENAGEYDLYYAPVGTDRYYFSPMEAAWKFRGPYSTEARYQMERHFDELQIERVVRAGETVSGYVLTNRTPGLKVFNVDLFGRGVSHELTFLMAVPGFKPDFANVDFQNLFAEADFRNVTREELRKMLADIPCCPADTAGNPHNAPINVILIADGRELLQALLRGGWYNVTLAEAETRKVAYLFDRNQDVVFRYSGRKNSGHYELRLWLTPVIVYGENVWAGEVVQQIDNTWSVDRRDPQVDIARNFLLQNLLYSQTVTLHGWVRGPAVAQTDSIWARLVDNPYFTDGYRSVLWVTGDPVAPEEIIMLDWDDARE